MPKVVQSRPQPVFLSRSEFAQRVGLGVRTIDLRIAEGTLKHLRPLGSKRVLIPVSEVDRLLQEAEHSIDPAHRRSA